MRTMTMKNAGRLLSTVALLAAVLPGPAAGRVGPRSYRLRMDGYVGPPPEGRREMASLLIRAGKKDVRFQVTAATVLSGSMLAANIFSRVRPYRPNFILRGPRATIAPFEDAEPGTQLRIIGMWRPGGRDLMVASIEKR
jgi:hypothetical protein